MLRHPTWQRLLGHDLSLPLVTLMLALMVLGTSVAVAQQPTSQRVDGTGKDGANVLDAIVDMTCFPVVPPAPDAPIVLDQPPPCGIPEGVDAYASPTPSGRAHVLVKDDDAVHFDIKLQGITPGQTVTAWLIYYFQFRPVPHPIFASIDPSKDLFGAPFAIAAHSVPLAPTGARYSEGLGHEPNQIFINRAGKGELAVKLDYNPLKPFQGPLRNGLVNRHQGAAPADSEAAQPGCCPGIVPPTGVAPQPVGSSFVREFDPATGFQALEADRRPKLVRSPVPAVFISIISSVDEHTKGINPGFPLIPETGVFGDHVVLGVFDLRPLHQPGEQFFAYVSNEGSNVVSVIDTLTDTIVNTITVGDNPIGVAAAQDSTKVYVVNNNAGSMSVIDTKTNTVVATIEGLGNGPLGVAVTPDGKRVYVTNFGEPFGIPGTTLFVIDTESNTVIDAIEVGPKPSGLAITPDGKRVYMTNEGSNVVLVIDTLTNTIVDTITAGENALDVAVSPDGTKVYVLNNNSSTVSVVDTKSNMVVTTIEGLGSGPLAVAVTPDGKRLYVTNFGQIFGEPGTTVSVIDTQSNTVVATIEGLGPFPISLAITPDGKRVYVLNQAARTVSVIDTLTNTVIGTIPFVNQPAGIAIIRGQ